MNWRVTHVIKAKRIAGAERHLLILLPGLRARGIDADLILLYDPREPAADFTAALEQAAVPLRQIPITRHADVRVMRQIQGLLRANPPDIVHTHLIHADLHAVTAARLARVPRVVSTRHNDDPFRQTTPIRMLNAALWRMTDAGITISDSLHHFTLAVEGAPPRKVRTIRYGLPPSSPDERIDRGEAKAALCAELNLPLDTLLLGLVCRLVEQKGVSVALDALAQVADEFPAHMVIAGEGVLRAALQAQARTLKLTERVHFLGWRDDTARLMAAFDIFLMPSLWEGFGLVLLEAMAQATPIIASHVSAIPEIVAHGETGLLVPPRQAPALAEALRLLLSDAALRRHMGLLGEDRLETHFSAARMIDETIAFYESIRKR